MLNKEQNDEVSDTTEAPFTHFCRQQKIKTIAALLPDIQVREYFLHLHPSKS